VALAAPMGLSGNELPPESRGMQMVEEHDYRTDERGGYRLHLSCPS